MRSRRARLLMALKENEVAPTVVAFPLLGASNDDLPRNGPVASSVLVPDEVINPHPRFGALTKNIRERRGSNVEVIAPLFQDDNTTGDAIKADAMAFGVQTASETCLLAVTQSRRRWRRAPPRRRRRAVFARATDTTATQAWAAAASRSRSSAATSTRAGTSTTSWLF